jgi:hypothetical protein
MRGASTRPEPQATSPARVPISGVAPHPERDTAVCAAQPVKSCGIHLHQRPWGTRAAVRRQGGGAHLAYSSGCIPTRSRNARSSSGAPRSRDRGASISFRRSTHAGALAPALSSSLTAAASLEKGTRSQATLDPSQYSCGNASGLRARAQRLSGPTFIVAGSRRRENLSWLRLRLPAPPSCKRLWINSCIILLRISTAPHLRPCVDVPARLGIRLVPGELPLLSSLTRSLQCVIQFHRVYRTILLLICDDPIVASLTLPPLMRPALLQDGCSLLKRRVGLHSGIPSG